MLMSQRTVTTSGATGTPATSTDNAIAGRTLVTKEIHSYHIRKKQEHSILLLEYAFWDLQPMMV
jgi:hypothetical protein